MARSRVGFAFLLVGSFWAPAPALAQADTISSVREVNERLAYYYRARTPQGPAFRSMLHNMVDTFFSGSKEALLCRLIKSENLSEDELLELKQLSDEDAETLDLERGEAK